MTFRPARLRSLTLSLSALALATAAGLANAAPAAVAAEPAPRAAEPMSAPAGRLGAEIVRHLNADTPAQLRRWAPTILSRQMAEADQRSFIQGLVATATDSGGVELLETRPEGPQGELLVLTLKSRRSGKQALLVLTADDTQAGTLRAADFMPQDDPRPYERWPERLGSLAELPGVIEPVLAELVRTDDFAGCLAVAAGGRTVYETCRGLAERSHGTPVDAQTRFLVGSMGKMFTAVAVAQLVEAGQLSWQANVAELLPEYPDRDAARQMTVWDLLHHTTGLGDFFVPEFFEHRERFADPADYLDLIARQPRASAPGEGWSYSNAGYVVLGRIIEKVSGEAYGDYLQRHILAPAGMTSSGLDSLEDITPHLATGYFRDAPFAARWKANWMTLPFKGSPAGGGFSTSADLLRFADALQSGRLVKDATLARMFEDGVPAGPGRYAAGFGDRPSHGLRVRGHAGGAPGMSANLAIVWETRAAVAVTSNLGPSDAVVMFSERLADLLAASRLPAPATPLSPAAP